jgi:hypothetical protein
MWWAFLLTAVALLLGEATRGSAGYASGPPMGEPQQAGGVAAAEPKFRLVRSVSGTKGSQRGDQYVIEDPRTVFYLPEDKQIIVYFEWEGPLGPHHLEGFWKNPEGKVVVISDFNYESKQKRFAGFWTLLLSESMPTGVWSLEAHIDGEVAGTHNFQIAVAPRPAAGVPSRPLLGPAEIYKLALPATVSIERLDNQRRRLGLGSGFVLEKDLIATSFENIEGASYLRVVLANGASLDFDSIVAWNRREDWALLRMASPVSNSLAAPKPNSWEVGDRCFSLDSPQQGGRTIVDGGITGSHKFKEVGDRLNLNLTLSRMASGSPLLNQYGEVIGVIVSSSLIPGLSSLALLREGDFPRYPGNLLGGGFTVVLGLPLAVPISAIPIPKPETPATALADLAKSGLFPESLVRNDNLLQGTVAKSIRRAGTQMEAVDQKFEFQRKDTRVSVLITWHGESKLKSSAFLKIYNIDNKLVGTTTALKLNVPKGQLVFSVWTFEVGSLPDGTYRVDLVLGSDPVWRSFFRLVD